MLDEFQRLFVIQANSPALFRAPVLFHFEPNDGPRRFASRNFLETSAVVSSIGFITGDRFNLANSSRGASDAGRYRRI